MHERALRPCACAYYTYNGLRHVHVDSVVMCVRVRVCVHARGVGGVGGGLTTPRWKRRARGMPSCAGVPSIMAAHTVTVCAVHARKAIRSTSPNPWLALQSAYRSLGGALLARARVPNSGLAVNAMGRRKQIIERGQPAGAARFDEPIDIAC